VDTKLLNVDTLKVNAINWAFDASVLLNQSEKNIDAVIGSTSKREYGLFHIEDKTQQKILIRSLLTLMGKLSQWKLTQERHYCQSQNRHTSIQVLVVRSSSTEFISQIEDLYNGTLLKVLGTMSATVNYGSQTVTFTLISCIWNWCKFHWS